MHGIIHSAIADIYLAIDLKDPSIESNSSGERKRKKIVQLNVCKLVDFYNFIARLTGRNT